MPRMKQLLIVDGTGGREKNNCRPRADSTKIMR